MNPSVEELEHYRKAGQIASKVRKAVPNIVKPGKKLLEVCEEVENMIFRLGGKLAFPCTIGINEVSAHFTPFGSYTGRIPEGSIVKIDLGAHLNGYIADTAITIPFDSAYESMTLAVEDALRDAIKNIKPGMKISDIGYIIEKNIIKCGYKPIRNLTGHKIERFSLHCGKSIPNIAQMNGRKIERGEVFAIEPFATYVDASGVVKNDEKAYIFKYNKEKGAKSKEAIKILRYIRSEFSTLPFTIRWLENLYPEWELLNHLKEMISSKCITAYNVLIEESYKPVAQAEHTIIVNEAGCEVLTL